MGLNGGFEEIVRGGALVAFALGGLLYAVGSAKSAKRCIVFAALLVVAEPIFVAGIRKLSLGEFSLREESLDRLIVGAAIAAVALAGLVALLRTRGGRGAEATSQKKRIERAP